MTGENDGVCHGCRQRDHVFPDCPNKVRCPGCKVAYVKWFVVVKKKKNKGKMFKCCSEDCGYFVWVNEDGKIGESSSAGNPSTNHVATGTENNVCGMFEMMCRLTREEDVEITLTIRKGNATAESEKKGKGPA